MSTIRLPKAFIARAKEFAADPELLATRLLWHWSQNCGDSLRLGRKSKDGTKLKGKGEK